MSIVLRGTAGSHCRELQHMRRDPGTTTDDAGSRSGL